MPSSDDQNLASALKPEQQQQLSILISTIIRRMRQRIASRFEENKEGLGQQTQDKPLVQQGDGASQELEKTPSIAEDQNDTSKDEPEISTHRDEELKKTALAFFDDWQGKVQHRLREVLGGAQAPKSRSPFPGQPYSKASPPNATPPSLADHYPPFSTPLSTGPLPSRISILEVTLLLLLSLTTYPPHSRILLLYLSTSLSLPDTALSDLEVATAQTLLSPEAQSQNQSQNEPPAQAKPQSQTLSSSAKWKVGLATLSGAALIGITGGLATPLVAAGVGGLFSTLGLGGTVVAGYLGALAGSGVVVGGLFGAYGGKVAGDVAQEWTREVEGFGILPLRELKDGEGEGGEVKGGEGEKEVEGGQKGRRGKEETEEADKRLTVTIVISGLLHATPRDLYRPWLSLLPLPTSTSFASATTSPQATPPSSIFTLRFSPTTILSFTSTISSFPTSYATTFLQSEILKRTALAPLLAATWPLSFLKFGKVLDNPFSLARVRADKAGVVLADALTKERVQGGRPVRLVGFSMGARVVVSCCRELAKRGAVGVLEDVVLMGAPVSNDQALCSQVRAVVAGRVVNVYSRTDWVLGILERVGSLGGGVAGIEEVRNVEGVENLDVSDLVSGHSGWMAVVGRVLERCGWIGLDAERLKQEKKEGEMMEQEQEKKMEEKAGVVDGSREQQLEKEEEASLEEVEAWLNEHPEPIPIDRVEK